MKIKGLTGVTRKYNPSHTTNPVLLGGKRVQQLCKKSSLLFKYKWHWRKLSELKGFTVDEIEREMDIVIEQHNQRLIEMEGEINAKKDGTKE